MIPYERTRQQTIPNSAVKIIGVGGAGANMLDRIALDGMEGAELLACNTDVRTLTSSVAPEKIQIGRNLTKGLGAGGDPELGRQAASEAELEIRDALRDRKIIFLCVGLGGGTGSGAAPLIARLAREEGAFTVVFATTPFSFEGQRRRDQAETALNELSVLANALITFDNTRMGELVLAKQGVHEAFSAADRMISESIRAVTRIVMRPGLVNIGLDDLMAALSSPKSRCLFGSGIAHGENRSQQALKNALSSPLLDRGSLLHDTQTVLVHVCGGEDMTLYELELLMRGLSKHVPDTAQILFGTSVDPAMAESLSVTLVSSLPEERLLAGLQPTDSGAPSAHADYGEEHEVPVEESEETEHGVSEEEEVHARVDDVLDEITSVPVDVAETAVGVASVAADVAEPVLDEPALEWEHPEEMGTELESSAHEEGDSVGVEEDVEFVAPMEGAGQEAPQHLEVEGSDFSEEAPGEETPPQVQAMAAVEEVSAELIAGLDPVPVEEPESPAVAGGEEVGDWQETPKPSGRRTRRVRKPRVRVKKMRPPREDEEPVKLPPISPDSIPDATPRVKLPARRTDDAPVEEVFQGEDESEAPSMGHEPATGEMSVTLTNVAEEVAAAGDLEIGSFEAVEPSEAPVPVEFESLEEIQASANARRPQDELALDGGPKGKFEGENPNLLEGEDLDIPPFLRNKK